MITLELVMRKVFRRISPCDAPCCLRPKSEGSAFGFQYFRGHMGSLALRPATRSPSLKMVLSIGLRILSFLPSCYSSYGAWTLTPVGLSPTVHASLRWTHTYRYRYWLALRPNGPKRHPAQSGRCLHTNGGCHFGKRLGVGD